MTYNEFFREAQKIGIPLADIRVVFNGYFHMPFDYIGIHGEETAENAENALFLLKQGYPSNYLAGYIDILSLHIFLDESTLIPRNETADFIYNYLYKLNLNEKKILDLCTGSGFIAIALKKKFPKAEIFASDISKQALTMAEKSSKLNEAPIHFIHSDFLKDIHESFDIIVSNPPYIEENSNEVLAPFEPRLALFSGMDGLDSYRSIFKDLDSHLNKDGKAYFEMESTNSENTKSLFDSMHSEKYSSSIWKDSYDRDRYLIIESLCGSTHPRSTFHNQSNQERKHQDN